MTRILFLTHPEADYGEYFLYNGLCEVLGEENVLDFPYKRSYHGEVHTYARPWEGGKTGVTAPFEFAKARKGQDRSLAQVLDLCGSNSFDLVVVGSPRAQAVQSARQLRLALRDTRIVLHDGEDYSDIRNDVASLVGASLYLKRELLSYCTTTNGAVVKPFPFSCALSAEPCDKQVDILCAVGNSNPAREVAMRVVAEIPSLRVLVGHWGWSRYIELTAQARIAVAPRGHGQDTVRRWDIPAFDTLLMCERLSLIEEYPLVDGVHCVYYTGPEELRQKLSQWAKDETSRTRVAAEGRSFVQEHHTNAARARQLLQWAGI